MLTCFNVDGNVVYTTVWECDLPEQDCEYDLPERDCE